MAARAAGSNSDRRSERTASNEAGEHGFRFPFCPDSTGGFSLVGGADVVEQSVRLLLRTAPGERVMRPDYGCRIHDLLFAPNNAATRGRVAHHVREAIERWEPRARDLDVRVTFDERTPERIVVELHYTCALTGNRHSLPHPLPLQGPSKGPSTGA